MFCQENCKILAEITNIQIATKFTITLLNFLANSPVTANFKNIICVGGKARF